MTGARRAHLVALLDVHGNGDAVHVYEFLELVHVIGVAVVHRHLFVEVFDLQVGERRVCVSASSNLEPPTASLDDQGKARESAACWHAFECADGRNNSQSYCGNNHSTLITE